MTPSVYQNLADKINDRISAQKLMSADDARELWMQMLHHQIIDATMPPEAVRIGAADTLHYKGPLGNPIHDDVELRVLQAQDDITTPPAGQIGGDLTEEQHQAFKTFVDGMRHQPQVHEYQGSVLYPASISYVADFHEKFGHPIAAYPNVGDAATRVLRLNMLLEEVLEFAEACRLRVQVLPSYNMEKKVWEHPAEIFTYETGGDPDIVEMADALGDIDYLASGASLVFGFPHCEIMEAIHNANLSKLGADGQPIRREDGKILKGPNYVPPTVEIKRLLDERILEGQIAEDNTGVQDANAS